MSLADELSREQLEGIALRVGIAVRKCEHLNVYGRLAMVWGIAHELDLTPSQRWQLAIHAGADDLHEQPEVWGAIAEHHLTALDDAAVLEAERGADGTFSGDRIHHATGEGRR